VRNVATNDRISLPFFLDPGWAAPVDPLLLGDHWTVPSDRAPRWDRTNLADVSGTYGDWLIAKVRQVFPQLASTVLEDRQANDR
jgi:isopenicillin N synthase-like dioxygenase